MIVNLPAHAGPANNGHMAATTANGGGDTATSGACEFTSFLKRKLKVEDEMPNQQQQINNTECHLASRVYSNSNKSADSGSAFKKRHIELSPNSSGIMNNNNNTHSDTSSYGSSGAEFVLADFGEATVTHASSSNSATGASDMTFNLIGSSTFMHDLFAYDANLMVPLTANVVASGGECITSTGSAYSMSPVAVISSTPTPVAATAYADEADANWQEASELLELDHRYTTGLQTDIAQLNATMQLKDSAVEATTNELNMQPQTQTHSPRTAQQMDFLVPAPQKSNATRYQHATNTRQHHIGDANDAGGGGGATDCDFEDKNLSWLLNFKFDEFPHLSPDIGAATSSHGNNAAPIVSPLSTSNNASSGKSTTCHSAALNQPAKTGGGKSLNSDPSRSPKTTAGGHSHKAAGKKFEELVMEVTAELDGGDLIVSEQVVVEEAVMKAPKKPPFTYTELIEYALEDKGELTVSGIYQWISDRFPYYKSNDDRWKNSVRHNLSINPHFRKGVKAPQGAGHLWTISSGDSAENVLAWEHKKQRLDLFFKMESMNRERLQQHQQLQQQRQQQHHCNSTPPAHNCSAPIELSSSALLNDEAATAAATITREMLQSHPTAATQQHHHLSADSCLQAACQDTETAELPFIDLMSDEELRKTAGQILNGMHREVEVQSVNSIISTYHDVLLDNEDYLNPIHKDVSVQESGLRHLHTSSHVHHASHHANNHPNNNNFYVAEIDPMELGIHMSHEETVEEVLFNDDFNLNYFGYSSAGNDIVA